MPQKETNAESLGCRLRAQENRRQNDNSSFEEKRIAIRQRDFRHQVSSFFGLLEVDIEEAIALEKELELFTVPSEFYQYKNGVHSYFDEAKDIVELFREWLDTQDLRMEFSTKHDGLRDVPVIRINPSV